MTPGHFVAWWRYFDALMRGPSGLSKTQREMIAVVISAEASCPYCLAAHAAALRLEPRTRRWWSDWWPTTATSISGLATGAMLDFAVKLTRAPDACDPSDLDRLRGAGFTDEDILHIVEVTAMFNYNVRLATATGLVPNDEYHELGRVSR